MKPILYIGCPQPERAGIEKSLGGAGLSVVWADSGGHALNELQRVEMPVLVDLSRGAAALQLARDLRAQRPGVLLFAVVDDRRPDLTAEAVLTGQRALPKRLVDSGFAFVFPELASALADLVGAGK